MPSLELKNEFYPPDLLGKWRKGDYSFLKQSNASDFIKAFLIKKAEVRTGKRFFGEAYIASTIKMSEGWYSSYKWLTQSKWITGHGLKSDFEERFHNALLKHFGVDTLRALQNKSNLLFNNYKNHLFHCGKYHKPVAPDLWLVDSEGTHYFLESKLPDDCIKASQIAGLALIAKHLNGSKRLRLVLVNLYPENSEPKGEKDTLEAFSYFYGIA
jgi:hypothetical protein